ncbi:MAG: hypothetical protein IJT08_00325 [Alphaproteobacteria bacterium]|nr:hypothetical protein [Alphaproteobacteria bacterium]
MAGVVNQHGDTLKHLVVSYSPNPEDAYYMNGKMKFSNKPMLGQQLLNKMHRGNNNYEICVKEDIKTNIVDITLIHEFLHWFHHLRSRVRYENYRAGRQANANANARVQGLSIVRHPVTSGMFNNIAGINDSDQINRSQTPWLNNSGQCDFEEILTILGRDTVTRGNEYLEGDDLSENAYRISCNRREENYLIDLGITRLHF